MDDIGCEAAQGSWMSPGWRFRLDISREGDRFSGVLAEGLENGELDAANPDPELRSRRLLGIRLFDGLRCHGGILDGGRLYNPENGKSYSVRISLKARDCLHMRAYVGMRALGLTQRLERLSEREDLKADYIAREGGLDRYPAWTPAKARDWFDSRPRPIGCNFIPSNAVNQLEMWQERSFDPGTVERELALAASLGFNCLRVYLHDIPWRTERKGFLARISRFLDACGTKGLRVVFVLFDDCWNDDPRPGRQPAPRPGIHNSGWVRSPGSRLINDESRWPELEGYVSGVLRAFSGDPRVYAWDLYNEIGNSRGFLPNSTRLLARAFRWAREAGADQPLTAGIWKASSWFAGINEFLARNSDLISFHDYSPAESLKRRIDGLSGYGKPLICTEYMARSQGSRFETHLPIFQENHVGALSWGLVAGKTQTIYPWGSRPGAKEPREWFHDIFRPDGTAYDPQEVAAIRRMTAGMAEKANR
jgi:uncharacterized protein (DUF2147 family)